MIKNPGAAWHALQGDYRTKESRKRLHQLGGGALGRRDPEYNFLVGQAAAEYSSATWAKEKGMRNPTRKHRKSSGGIGILGIAAIAGVAYLLLRNR